MCSKNYQKARLLIIYSVFEELRSLHSYSYNKRKAQKIKIDDFLGGSYENGGYIWQTTTLIFKECCSCKMVTKLKWQF